VERYSWRSLHSASALSASKNAVRLFVPNAGDRKGEYDNQGIFQALGSQLEKAQRPFAFTSVFLCV